MCVCCTHLFAFHLKVITLHYKCIYVLLLEYVPLPELNIVLAAEAAVTLSLKMMIIHSLTKHDTFNYIVCILHSWVCFIRMDAYVCLTLMHMNSASSLKVSSSFGVAFN